MMTRFRIMCSWCHHVNELDYSRVNSCEDCNHRSDRPRMYCDCNQCEREIRQLKPAEPEEVRKNAQT